MSEDSEFYKSFKGGMDLLRIPCPETLFGSLMLSISTLKSIADAVKTYGSRVTVKEAFLCIPTITSAATAGAFASEVIMVVGGMAASLYVGIVMGCLIGAAVDVYGTKAIQQIAGLMAEMSKAFGSVDKLIREAIRFNPAAAQHSMFQISMDIARGGLGGAAYKDKKGTAFA
jgi:hypothetical protein